MIGALRLEAGLCTMNTAPLEVKRSLTDYYILFTLQRFDIEMRYTSLAILKSKDEIVLRIGKMLSYYTRVTIFPLSSLDSS